LQGVELQIETFASVGGLFHFSMVVAPTASSMIPKSGYRISDKIMLKQRFWTVIRFN
jgi:hypothetical protein